VYIFAFGSSRNLFHASLLFISSLLHFSPPSNRMNNQCYRLYTSPQHNTHTHSLSFTYLVFCSYAVLLLIRPLYGTVGTRLFIMNNYRRVCDHSRRASENHFYSIRPSLGSLKEPQIPPWLMSAYPRHPRVNTFWSSRTVRKDGGACLSGRCIESCFSS
jgi:hypothetical protein